MSVVLDVGKDEGKTEREVSESGPRTESREFEGWPGLLELARALTNHPEVVGITRLSCCGHCDGHLRCGCCQVLLWVLPSSLSARRCYHRVVAVCPSLPRARCVAVWFAGGGA